MDKRTITAIFLIVIIFILTPYYYEWVGIKPKPTTTPTDSIAVDSLGTDSLQTLAEKQETIPAIAQTRTNAEIIQKERSEKPVEKMSGLFISNPDTQDIVIENDFFKAVLTLSLIHI